MSQTNKIGLCIGGGGAKGVAAIAIIEALLERGIEFSAISGTSIGAIIGAYLASHGEVTSLRDTLLGFSKREWFNLLDPSIRNKRALFKGQKFHKLYKSMFGDTTFHALDIPLTISATDLQGGHPHYFRSGKVLDAVLASSAYPGLFPPHQIDDKSYVDGGVFDNLPYEVLLEQDMDKVIGINLLSINTSHQTDYSTMSSVITRSMDLMMGIAFKHNVPPRKDVYLFSPEFTGRVSSSFGIMNLEDKYKIGQQEYERVEQDFTDWLA